MLGNMPPKINAMLIMNRERRLPLIDALESCAIEVLAVCDCNEARQILETQLVQVVVTDTTLPDGDWRRVLEIVERGRRKIQVVVCSRLGDPKLWLDVLEEGGYDVLVEPYEREEVKRIVAVAPAIKRKLLSLLNSPSRPSHLHEVARVGFATQLLQLEQPEQPFQFVKVASLVIA
jgi:DNA-binding NtrC family response regulator